MSDSPQNVGKTLTGGIQDVAALLPLLGTDQCEQHVGSALEGGYLYAAAAPLSIFGSLGIVKVGISVLVSSISIPKISISFRKFSVSFSQDRWLGARTLNNAGFKPAGTVAALIAMDGTCYKAETRVMQILEEKHIDNPENLSISWKSRKWNVSLVLFTILAAVISGTPYIALLLQNPSSSGVHTPWIFPLLRTVGSCFAAISCQFLIQSRVISLMKNRIIFTVINRLITGDPNEKPKNPGFVLGLKEHLRWDEILPAEQCLWSLERFLTSQRLFNQPSHGPNELGAHLSIAMTPFSFLDPEGIRSKLQQLRNEQFLTPGLDHTFVLISWIVLGLSLPATVAGYIGCFTLVSDSQGNGPLIWLGLEAALSIARILIWAWNPRFDEETVTVKVKLTEDQPLVTTEKEVRIIESTGDNTLPLVPERQFLEWITPYTGPLEQFRSSESLALYFTLTASGLEQKCLYMTVFDFNKQIAVTILQEDASLKYINAVVICNHTGAMEAVLQSTIGEEHPWQTNADALFDTLANYYRSVISTLNRLHLHTPAPDISRPDLMATVTTSTFQWKWNLLPKYIEPDSLSSNQVLNSPTAHDQLYLARGYEHHLKTELIENWSRWIIKDMTSIRSDAQNDCHHARLGKGTKQANWEHAELNSQLIWEWTRRELLLLTSSITLEGILQRRMESCIHKVTQERGNMRLKEWMQSEFVIGQRKRLEKEKAQTKKRMEKEFKDASEHAKRERRPWPLDEGQFSQYSIPRMEDGLEFIEKHWSAGINAVIKGKHFALEDAVSELDQLIASEDIPLPSEDAPLPSEDLPLPSDDESLSFDDLPQLTTESLPDDDDSEINAYLSKRAQRITAKHMRQQFEHWHPQRENERHEMDATIGRIRDSGSEHLEDAYRYPKPDDRATHKFVRIGNSPSLAMACSATVYEADCNENILYDVIKKSTTRSVINVDPSLLDSIPPNNHLLYVGSRPSWDDGKMPQILYIGPRSSLDYGKTPAFVQRNRDRWWNEQVSNSSTFYFSPKSVSTRGEFVLSEEGTIAHIFIFLATPCRVRLHLLQMQSDERCMSASIQENGEELCHITNKEISHLELHPQSFELGQFVEGRHELELVVFKHEVNFGYYGLRNIFVEFCNRPPRFVDRAIHLEDKAKQWADVYGSSYPYNQEDGVMQFTDHKSRS